jgi:hypothetical protein
MQSARRTISISERDVRTMNGENRKSANIPPSGRRRCRETLTSGAVPRLPIHVDVRVPHPASGEISGTFKPRLG